MGHLFKGPSETMKNNEHCERTYLRNSMVLKIYMCVLRYIHVCVYECMCVHMCVYMCMHVCICL